MWRINGPTAIADACILLLFILVVIIAIMCARGAAPPYYGGRQAKSTADAMRADAMRADASPSSRPFPLHIIDWSRRVPNAADYSKLEMAPGGRVTLYSSLMPWHVASMQKALKHIFRSGAPASITDASAHIGADAVNFLRVFPQAKLTAVEVDPAVSAITKRNLAYAARAPAAVVITGDGAAHIENGAPTDMLYLDPPWGGASAAERQNGYDDQHMRLGGRSVPDLVVRALQRGFGTVVVKLPRESSTAAFSKAVRDASQSAVRCHAYAICDARRTRPGASCDHAAAYWLVSCVSCRTG